MRPRSRASGAGRRNRESRETRSDGPRPARSRAAVDPRPRDCTVDTRTKVRYPALTLTVVSSRRSAILRFMIRACRPLTVLTMTALFAVVAAACGRRSAGADHAPAAAAPGHRDRRRSPPPPPPPPPAATPSTPAPLTEEQLFAQKSLEQLNAERPLADVFFDLDQSTIRDDAQPALQKNADWMKRWTSTQDHDRRALRLARQLRVQPRARHPARRRP